MFAPQPPLPQALRAAAGAGAARRRPETRGPTPGAGAGLGRPTGEAAPRRRAPPRRPAPLGGDGPALQLADVDENRAGREQQTTGAPAESAGPPHSEAPARER
jgi:hypothetical protein